MCGVKKGQSVYWFSVFTPGSASLSSEVTALATVMTQGRQSQVKGGGQRSSTHHPRHLQRHEQRLLLLMSLVNSERCLSRFTLIPLLHQIRGQTHCITALKTLPPVKTFISTLKIMNSEGRFTQNSSYRENCAFVHSMVNLKETNSHHRKGEFSSMASSFFVIAKNDLKWGAPGIWIFHSHPKIDDCAVIMLVVIGLEILRN